MIFQDKENINWNIQQNLSNLEQQLAERLPSKVHFTHKNTSGLPSSHETLKTKTVLEFQCFDQLENLLSKLEPVPENYLERFHRVSWGYCYYLVSMNELVKIKSSDKMSHNFIKWKEHLEANIQALLSYKHIFFDYVSACKTLSFVDLQNKIKFKTNFVVDTDYQQKSLAAYEDQSNETIIVTKCVGCNSEYTKFHLIDNETNPKDVPVLFAYHYNNEKPSWKINPPRINRINVYDLEEHKDNLLDLLVTLLNNNGGFVMIGCQELTKVPTTLELYKQISSIQSIQFTRFNVVIGEKLTEDDKVRIKKQLAEIIQRVQPEITLEKNIQIRYLPVKTSEDSKGYIFHEIYQDEEEEEKDSYVILIAVKPKTPPYSLSSFISQEQQQNFSLTVVLEPLNVPPSSQEQGDFVSDSEKQCMFGGSEGHRCTYKKR